MKPQKNKIKDEKGKLEITNCDLDISNRDSDGWQKLIRQPVWFSVKETLPKEGSFVICYGVPDLELLEEICKTPNINKESFYSIISCQFVNGQWLYPNIDGGGFVDFGESITHWMPLPSPPVG